MEVFRNTILGTVLALCVYLWVKLAFWCADPGPNQLILSVGRLTDELTEQNLFSVLASPVIVGFSFGSVVFMITSLLDSPASGDSFKSGVFSQGAHRQERRWVPVTSVIHPREGGGDTTGSALQARDLSAPTAGKSHF